MTEKIKLQTTELLSPAGDYECFLAAIHAGADAVYLGGSFSARAYAKNFTVQEILLAIDYAHLYGRKVYLTLNILMKDSELNAVYDQLKPLYEAGLDGVIVQDLGLVTMLNRFFPDLAVHASTQMTVTDTEAVRLLQELGAKRVVLARECSLKEIKRIKEETGAELECFIHGALCYSYSGKCLMSSMLGERSGNRGRCAQPCRLPYDGRYPLSCKDICTLQILPALIDAGIDSLKIEGRMKSADYVAAVTGIYRKYLDLIQNDPKKPYEIDEQDLNILHHVYTRSGHSQGYYQMHNGPEMITMSKPCYEKTEETLKTEAFQKYTKDFQKIPVRLLATCIPGQPFAVTASAKEVSVRAVGETVLKAQNRALGKEDIEKQLKKLGSTAFQLQNIEIETEGDAFLPVSAMNATRRQAIDLLLEQILLPYRRDQKALPYAETELTTDDVAEERPYLHVSVTTEEQLFAALLSDRIDLLSVPADLLGIHADQIEETVEKSRRSGREIRMIATLPFICRDSYFQRNGDLDQILSKPYVSGVLIRNLESLQYLRAKHYAGKIIGDLHLYELNRRASNCLKELGVNVLTVPVELNRNELLERKLSREDLILYGRVPLMVSAQCVRKTNGQCTQKEGFTQITDRYHVSFPVQCVCSECYNIIYNSVPLSLHAKTELISKLKPYSVRLSFTTENAQEVLKTIGAFAGLVYKGEPIQPDYAYTKGHIQRGVE